MCLGKRFVLQVTPNIDFWLFEFTSNTNNLLSIAIFIIQTGNKRTRIERYQSHASDRYKYGRRKYCTCICHKTIKYFKKA